MKSFPMIYKFMVICLLLCSLCLVAASGISLYLGFNFSLSLYLHLTCACFLVLFAVLHFINRRSKFRKLKTQMYDVIMHSKYPSYCTLDRLIMTFEGLTIQQLIDTFQLDETQLKDAFQENRIFIQSNQQTLRQVTKNDDEKIFLAIDIVTRLKFLSI
ncbi:hypothetical protein [Pasteurella bettyae]|nr:transmembrane protein [Pasteurella bettyae]